MKAEHIIMLALPRFHGNNNSIGFCVFEFEVKNPLSLVPHTSQMTRLH